MSLNTAHANGGVLIHAGECILVFSDNVTMEFHGNDQAEFHGKKIGRLYLTTHRMVFNVKDSRDKMQSFSFPFVTLSNVELEQPVFGANFIKGKVRAQPNGNWIGEAKFKLMFKTGGAIDFGQAMLRAAQMASRNGPPRDAPPPYTAPMGDWYAAPPPAYAPPPAGYYGWTPPTQAFPDAPPPNSVFMTDNPPPYPGINGYNGYAPAPQQQQQQPGMGYPQQAAFAPQGAAGYQQQYPSAPGFAPPQGYPQQQQGYPPQQQGYPPQQQGYPAQQGYPPQQGYPQQGYAQQNGGAMGFAPPQNNGFQTAPSAPDAKASEAAQSAYYDPSRPQCAYVPPPAYYESPPTYQTATSKKDQ